MTTTITSVAAPTKLAIRARDPLRGCGHHTHVATIAVTTTALHTAVEPVANITDPGTAAHHAE